MNSIINLMCNMLGNMLNDLAFFPPVWPIRTRHGPYKHVERPGGSHTALDGKKVFRGSGLVPKIVWHYNCSILW